MSDKNWYEAYFGDDYLDIHSDDLPPELTQAQVEGIVALLDLQPGARILDLACGHGRHSILLAGLGFDVTGYDLSPVFLARARADAAAAGVSVRWQQGDMRALPFAGEFDAAINMFTAFGYFDDPADDVKALQGVRRALRPGGRFLLETVHRDALMGNFADKGWHETSAGTLVLRQRELDLATDVMHENVQLVRSDGTRRSYQTTIRIRSLSGYLALFRAAGLAPAAWYGGLDGRKLKIDSWRLVVVGQKPAT